VERYHLLPVSRDGGAVLLDQVLQQGGILYRPGGGETGIQRVGGLSLMRHLCLVGDELVIIGRIDEFPFLKCGGIRDKGEMLLFIDQYLQKPLFGGINDDINTSSERLATLEDALAIRIQFHRIDYRELLAGVIGQENVLIPERPQRDLYLVPILREQG
jgi:hypothetical protein